MITPTRPAFLVLLLAGTALAEDSAPSVIPAVSQATTFSVEKASITALGAQQVLSAAVAAAAKNHWGMSIAVVDDAGRLLAFLRMDGAPMGTIDVAQGKAVTAVKFNLPTKAVQDMIGHGATAMLSVPGITALTGGYPIQIHGHTVGAIGVSGGLGEEDDITAQAGLAAVTH